MIVMADSLMFLVGSLRNRFWNASKIQLWGNSWDVLFHVWEMQPFKGWVKKQQVKMKKHSKEITKIWRTSGWRDGKRNYNDNGWEMLAPNYYFRRRERRKQNSKSCCRGSQNRPEECTKDFNSVITAIKMFASLSACKSNISEMRALIINVCWSATSRTVANIFSL